MDHFFTCVVSHENMKRYFYNCLVISVAHVELEACFILCLSIWLVLHEKMLLLDIVILGTSIYSYTSLVYHGLSGSGWFCSPWVGYCNTRHLDIFLVKCLCFINSWLNLLVFIFLKLNWYFLNLFIVFWYKNLKLKQNHQNHWNYKKWSKICTFVSNSCISTRRSWRLGLPWFLIFSTRARDFFDHHYV